MTLSIAFSFKNGILVYSDSRITYKLSDGRTIKRDLGQKIYVIKNDMVVNFAGDVNVANHLIHELTNHVEGINDESYYDFMINGLEPFLSNVYYRYWDRNKDKIDYVTSLIISGVTYYEPAVRNEDVADINFRRPKYLVISFDFKKDGLTKRTKILDNQKGIVAIGSGKKLVPQETLKDFYNLYKDDYFTMDHLENASVPVGIHGLMLNCLLEDIIKKGKIEDVGGYLHRIKINEFGSNYQLIFGMEIESGTFYLKKGFNGEKWLLKNENGEEHFLLEGNDIMKLSHQQMKDLLIE